MSGAARTGSDRLRIVSEPVCEAVAGESIVRAPSMAEILLRPRNGLRVASFFSGCGGSSLGYKLSGCDVVYANEFVEAAQKVYRHNYPDTYVDTRDIRKVRGADVVRAVGPIDIVDGSPPCASYSTAGKRQKLWGQEKSYSTGRTQRTDDLFPEYARIIDELKPRAFIAENVTGLVRGKAVGHFRWFVDAFRQCGNGYTVATAILDSTAYGVPQMRRRVFFVGFSDPTAAARFSFPTRTVNRTPTLRDGIWDLRNEPFDHETSHAGLGFERLWYDLKPGQVHPRRYNLIRCDWNRPCFTLNASPSSAGPTHPDTPRRFSLAEQRRIASLPDDFYLGEKWTEAAERVGRCVPPLLMEALSRNVAAALDDGAAATGDD